MFYNSANSSTVLSCLFRAKDVLDNVPLMPCFVGKEWKHHTHPQAAPSIMHSHLPAPIPARAEATEVGCTSPTSGCDNHGSLRGQPSHVTVAEVENRCKERTRDD
jgi:hypothetical protein